MRCFRVASVFLAATCGLVTAQDAPTPAQPPEAGDASFAGPKVVDKSTTNTLVSYDLQGNLRLLETSAEEAALPLLKLDAEAQERVDKMLQQRAAMVDQIVGDNLALLLRYMSAKAADDMGEATLELGRIFQKMEPLNRRGSLSVQVAAQLPGDKKVFYRQLVNEYWTALIEQSGRDIRAESKEPAPPPAPAGEKPKPDKKAMGRAGLVAFGNEIRRSYERQAAARSAKLDEAVNLLKLAPDKEAKVRKLASEYFQKTLGKPTPDQRRDFGAQIMQELTWEQRRTLVSELFGSGGGAAPSKAPAAAPSPAPGGALVDPPVKK